jgi:hypothetical protein
VANTVTGTVLFEESSIIRSFLGCSQGTQITTSRIRPSLLRHCSTPHAHSIDRRCCQNVKQLLPSDENVTPMLSEKRELQCICRASDHCATKGSTPWRNQVISMGFSYNGRTVRPQMKNRRGGQIMSSNLISGRSLLVSLALAGLIFESPAIGRQLNRRVNRGAANGVATTQVVNALKTAHQLLVVADHDYDGRRSLAAQEVHKALMELGHRQGTAHTGATGGTNLAGAGAKRAALAGQTKGKESQAKSDAQLRQAQQLLQGALTQISTRHPKAAANVNAAIGQINTALAIK